MAKKLKELALDFFFFSCCLAAMLTAKNSFDFKCLLCLPVSQLPSFDNDSRYVLLNYITQKGSAVVSLQLELDFSFSPSSHSASTTSQECGCDLYGSHFLRARGMISCQ